MSNQRFLFLSLTVIFCLARQVRCSLPMKRLYEDLFSDYNRLILPTANNNSKVTVTLGLKLGQILDLNLKQQILSTNVWVEQTWHDNKLQWSPELYDGIDMIHVPAENIWIPDIVLFNNADGNYELTLVAKARLYSNGTVVWRPPTMFRSTCEIDVEYFPFDIQTCYLRFGSWTYAGDEVELRHVGNRTKVNIGVDLSQFYKNVEWDIIDVPAYYNEVYYDCCSEPYPDITFKIVIRRKMLFYLVNLILPVALMTFMTVSVFYLPSHSNEKVTLSISILTSLIVFFLLMLEIIPASSLAVPLFGKYLLFTLVLVSLSACVSVYVLNIHHRSPSVHSMSPRVRHIFLKVLPRLMRLNQPDPRERSSLNRFRKKKVAQQLLKASVTANHKVYDLAQPIANSLNLIETLHKSYAINPKDDDAQNEEEEGRYFRRYVDEYIKNMKKSKSKGNQDSLTHRAVCCEHDRCCSMANKPLNSSFEVGGFAPDQCRYFSGQNYTLDLKKSVHASLGNLSSTCQLIKGSHLDNSRTATTCGCSMSRPKHGAMAQDDTFDMTFDCDDEQLQPTRSRSFSNRMSNVHECSSTPINQIGDHLPSPPPPPRQVTQLSDTLKSSGRMSSCSKQNLHLNSLDENRALLDSSPVDEQVQGQQLVDKLIHSINLINNASDEVDTTNTTSNNDPEDEDLYDRRNESFVQKGVVGREPSQVPSFGDISPLVLGSQNHSYTQTSTERPALRESHPCNGCGGQGINDSQKTSIPNSQQQQSSRGAPVRDGLTGTELGRPSSLLLSLRLPYDQMPAHVRAAIRSILFIADTIKNEDDENSAIEDWESMSMVVDRLFLWLFFLLCTFGSIIILALAPSLYDQRASIDDKLRIEIPPSNCSARVNAN